MTDPLDDLKKALQATPAPSGTARDAALRAAMEGFEKEFQGSNATARPNPERPHPVGAFWKGLITMFSKTFTRPALLGTASLATLAIAVAITNDYRPGFMQPAPVGTDFKSAAAAHTDAVLRLEPGQTMEDLGIREDRNRPTEEAVLLPPLLDEPQTESLAEEAPVIPPRTELAITEPESVPTAPDANLPVDSAAQLGATSGPGISRPQTVDDHLAEAETQFGDTSTHTPSEANQIANARSETTAPETVEENVGPITFSGSAELGVVFQGGRKESGGLDFVGDSGDTTVDVESVGASQLSLAQQHPAPQKATGLSTTNRQRPASISTGSFDGPAIVRPAPPTGESFAAAAPSAIKSTTTDPVSTFSVDVDTAAYSYIRATLTAGALPDPASVRIEEMINYFDYSYPAPETREIPFTTSVSVSETPWNADTQLIQIGLQGYELPADDRPPLNLVFLIDTSGSMNDANKLPLLISGFRLLLTALQPQDQIAIVTYAGNTGVALQPTSANNRAEILASLGNLRAGGSTAGAAGLQQAYALADTLQKEGETTRVILATDGDFNVGISDPEALKTFISQKRQTGTYLSVLGFGRGNLNDALMQSLAQNGNGNAAYIDTLAEAQRVLVDDMAGSFLPIASDVKIQVEFNPAQVSEYRLIGYETRALRREDFRNDRIDAGEIGAGHTVTALYEITPKGSPAEQLPPLRYSAEAEVVQPTTTENPELAFVKLRYKTPGAAQSQLISTPVLASRDDITTADKAFASAVAAFGEKLRGSQSLAAWRYTDIEALAEADRGEDRFGYRAEFLRLIRLAAALSQ